MAFTTPNFKIDSILLTFQPVEIEVEEVESKLIEASDGGYVIFEKDKGRIFHVTYGRGRMVPPGAMTELRAARNNLFVHSMEYTDEDGTVTATVIWPGNPPHSVVSPGHIGEFTFDLYEAAGSVG